MTTETVDLSFDPAVLADVKNDDDTPFFSEEHIKRLPGFEKFKGPKGQARLVKSHMELESLRGLTDKTLEQLKTEKEAYEQTVAEKYKKEYIGPLADDATDEEKAEWNKRLKAFLKVPEKPEDYELKLPDGADEDAINELRQLAHESNWSQESTQKAIDIYESLRQKSIEAFDDVQAEAQKTTDKILTKLWGGQKNKVEKVEQIRRMLREFVNPDWRSVDVEMDEQWKAFDKEVYISGVGNNHVLMEILGQAVDKGIGLKEGKTTVEMKGSVPVQKGKTWAELNPGIPEP